MKTHNEEYGCIGIDVVFLEEPAVNGFLDKNNIWTNKSTRMMYVYDNEGPIPHCHVVGLSKDGKKEVCVRLDAPEYFCHGSKQSKFTANEKKMFISFINSADKYGTIRWNWAASTWDGFAQNRTTMKEISTTKIPDYNKLDTE